MADPKPRHHVLQATAVYVPYWQAVLVKAWESSGRWIETPRTCHPATKQCLSRMCAALCLKYPLALAFVMFGACGLQHQNLLPKLTRQCFPDSFWLYSSLIVFLLLFFCCYFQGSAPANPGSVLRTRPHGKQLPLLWDLMSSPPPSLSLGLSILVYITKKQIQSTAKLTIITIKVIINNNMQ